MVFPNLIDHKEHLTGLGLHRTHSLAFPILRKPSLVHPHWEASSPNSFHLMKHALPSLLLGELGLGVCVESGALP